MKRYLSLAMLALGFSGVALAQDLPSFNDVDTNGDGKISQEEASQVEGVDFATWDANQDGYIDRQEWDKMASQH